MIRADAALSEAVEAAVRRAEALTDAEIVVVIAPRSGTYRDIALGIGVAVAWVMLLVLVGSPVNFSPRVPLIELPLVFAATAWAANRAPWLLALLTPKARAAAQVRSAASAAFHEEEVHTTRGRTGLLVYWSLLEGQVVLLPDQGLAGCVPEQSWTQITWGGPAGPPDLAHLIAGLDQLGALLAGAVPATGDNPNERPDAPRVRS